MSDDTKTPVGLLICNFGKWWRHMKTKNTCIDVISSEKDTTENSKHLSAP